MLQHPAGKPGGMRSRSVGMYVIDNMLHDMLYFERRMHRASFFFFERSFIYLKNFVMGSDPIKFL